ncbi:unnamed protein product [Spirodela intermedia]|uniref:DUF1421 domain-containing protein n=1 Tax=Spirodela intermedia TaxID=51605 RepID=A0A7I8KIG6_SPIIN|nr:unnamed protein product [Spirodela intermedia]
MEKQITGHAGGRSGDLMELLDPPESRQSNGAGLGREEILASYDFQPIRRSGFGLSPPASLDDSGGWAAPESTPMTSHFGARNYGSNEGQESSNVIFERSRDSYDTVTVAEVDSTVKKYADILLHAVEGVSSRLSQLESRTHKFENALDELKLSIGSTYGTTDGKLRHLDNVLREVQTGLQGIRDKQEIAEAQRQLSKLPAPGDDRPPLDSSSSLPTRSQPPPAHYSQPPLQLPAQPSSTPPPPPPALPTTLPGPPAPNVPPQTQLPHQNLPHQYSSEVPQAQVSSLSMAAPREAYYPPPGQPPAEPPQQHYPPPPPPPQQNQLPPPPPQQTQLLPPPQHYPPGSHLAQYSQPPQPSQSVPPQLQPPFPHQPEEPPPPYMLPPQNYPSSIHHPPQLATRPPHSQQIYGPTANIYENSSGSRQQAPGYGPAFSDAYPYSGSPSRYTTGREPSPFSSSSSSSAQSGGGGHQHLPTAQLLPAALPTASNSGGSSGNRVPVDDVVERVTSMGFPRDLVRERVRRLTENGQSVDLNVVLDKLMNGEESQARKAWFGK